MKTYRLGTHRAVAPKETLARIQPHLLKMGITRLANVTGLDDIGIPVVTACRPNAKAVAVSQGKGVSLAAAKVSAAMEAIETYHAEHINLPMLFTSYNQLIQQQKVVDIEALPRMELVPFCPDTRRLWIAACECQTQAKVYVPYDLVHCDFTLPLPPASGSFQLSTNGLASGNTLAEASVHALCELIERDAMTLWSLMPEAQKAQQKVNLTTVTDPIIQNLITKIEQADVMLTVWNITSDLGVPTFIASIINKNESLHRPLYPMSGSGTHLDKQVALMRAITEAVQTRLTLISGSRDDASRKEYQIRQDSQQQQRVRAKLTATPPYVDFADIPTFELASSEEDLQLLQAKFSDKNLPMPMMIDLTKPEFDIPVVRAIAPGLEGIYNVPGYQFGQRAKQFLTRLQEEVTA